MAEKKYVRCCGCTIKNGALCLGPETNLRNFKLSKAYEPSITRALTKYQVGSLGLKSLRHAAQNCVIERLKEFDVYATEDYGFTKRITAMKWHPTKPTYIAVGSKFGDVLFRNVATVYNDVDSFEGQRHTCRFQAITCLSFDPFSDSGLFLSGLDGNICYWDYEVDSTKELLDKEDINASWYCSLAASTNVGLIAAGDSKGFLTFFDKTTRKPVLKERIHTDKVGTVEFHCKGWMLATASIDCSAKIWDIRMMGGEKHGKRKIDIPLFKVKQRFPLNSAYFSRTNGGQLLTTDQHMELRVYSVPSFTPETLIYHPHPHFEYLTPIKATWHPLTDLIVVGRYPDAVWPDCKGDVRSVDIIDCKSGNIQTRLIRPKGVLSLNEFNMNGEILASSMGFIAAYWKFRPDHVVTSFGVNYGDDVDDGNDDDDNDDDDNDANDNHDNDNYDDYGDASDDVEENDDGGGS